jgi:hypothetical protein
MKTLIFFIFALFSLVLILASQEKVYGITGEENQTINVTPPSVVLNLTFNPNPAWWNDTINASGYALWTNGDPFNQTVQVNRSDDTMICNVTANNVTGYYSCLFNAPLELGDYYHIAYAINETGGIKGNSSSVTLQVKPTYGKKAIGTADRVVYEVPMLIQDFNGKIRQAWVRIMTWKGT